MQMEHRSELVAEGKLIGETTYSQRPERWQQIAIDGIKIDHFDAQLGVVHEVKKSDKQEHAHIAQLKYYLYVLKRNNIRVSHGVLEYPTIRKTKEIIFTEQDGEEIPNWEIEVEQICTSSVVPQRLNRAKCRHCSYTDFCWS